MAWSLAWRHKWMLNIARALPQIPLERLEGLLSDFKRRAYDLGETGNTGDHYDLKLAMHRGDRVGAQAAFGRWQAGQRDDLSDCPACDAQQVADYYAFLGDAAASVQAAERLLHRGQSCAEIPHVTYASLLPPLMRLGEWGKAAEYAALGRGMVAGDPDHLSSQADHLTYLALTDRPAALGWYARHLPWAEQSRELLAVLQFHKAAALLFRVWQDREGSSMPLTLPSGVPGFQPAGEYDAAERYHYHLGEAQRIAALFDARVGNTAKAEGIQEMLALAALTPSA